MKTVVALIALILWTGAAIAEDHGHAAPASRAATTHAGAASHGATADKGHGEAHEAGPGPVISGDSKWVGSVLIILAALFVAAAVIGPIYRASLPEAPPEPDAHDDHAAHHGHDDHHNGHDSQGSAGEH